MTVVRVVSLAAVAIVLCGCAVLPFGGKPRVMHTYLLDTQLAGVQTAAAPGCQVVVVSSPRQAPGLGGPQMIYRREANRIERFAYSRWADSPANMLEPLLADALESRRAFAGVLAAPVSVRADMRVETDSLALVQVFQSGDSHVELRANVRVFAPAGRRLLASRAFAYDEPADAATPQAGVAAADRAVARFLADFSDFVVQAGAGLEDTCRSAD